MPQLVKAVLFDGTFYHLWYLPATAIGAIIAFVLLRRFSLKNAFFITLGLYAIGLMGDSYYGAIQGVVPFKILYSALFDIFSFTRNGVFFAPVFYIMGAIIAKKQTHFSFKKNCICFMVAFTLMLIEAMAVKAANFPRHDSMLIMLLPCSYFLLSILCSFRKRRIAGISSISLYVYILHPIVIIIVRGIGKVLHLEWLLIDFTLTHFLAVAVGSTCLALLTAYCMEALRQRFQKASTPPRCVLSIDNAALLHNALSLQKMLSHGKLMAVVKANAYGHGAKEVAFCLECNGVSSFATATLNEALDLRKAGIKGEILVLGYTCAKHAKTLIKHNIMQTVVSVEHGNELAKNGAVQVHIKIDTGMHRLGIPMDNIHDIANLFLAERLKIKGIFTHLAASNSRNAQDIEHTQRQINSFYKCVRQLTELGVAVPKIHIQSSAGLLYYPQVQCDYARVGLALFGIGDFGAEHQSLRPVMRLCATVVLCRTLKKGEAAGYDFAFTAKNNCSIAVISIGYADGIPRNLGEGKGNVIISGVLCMIIGRICMDCLLVDVSKVNVAVGDVAVLIGSEDAVQITIDDIAVNAGTIPNEICSRLHVRND